MSYLYIQERDSREKKLTNMRVTLKQTSNGLQETHTEKNIKLRKTNK